MRHMILAGLLGTALLGGCNKGGGGATSSSVQLQTDQDKTLYALGLFEAQRMAVFSLTPQELAIVQAGIADGATGAKPKVELATWQPKIQELFETRRKEQTEKAKAKSKAFLDEAAKEQGATKTASGLVYKSIKEGAGAQPVASDVVKVNYEGKLTDGTVFDSSYQRNQPAEFPLGGVIKCWTEGVGMMKVGGKAKLVCPSEIAYGDFGSPPKIPGGSTLIFEVELLDIVKKDAPAAPAAAPALDPHGHPIELPAK